MGKCSKYSWVYMHTESDLIQAFPCCRKNQATTIKELEKLSAVYGYPHLINNDQRTYFKILVCKTGQKIMTLNGVSISLIICKQKGYR